MVHYRFQRGRVYVIIIKKNERMILYRIQMGRVYTAIIKLIACYLANLKGIASTLLLLKKNVSLLLGYYQMESRFRLFVECDSVLLGYYNSGPRDNGL